MDNDQLCSARHHGTFYAYELGCRCEEVKRRYYKLRSRYVVRGTGQHDTSRSGCDDLNVEIAVARVRSGDTCPIINVPERRAVVATLTGLGWSCRRIARALGLAERSVQRYKTDARRADGLPSV
jgi:hypothetical protein